MRTNKKAVMEDKTSEIAVMAKMAAMTSIVNRTNLFKTAGQTYSGDRSIYDALGYPQEINFNDYYARYVRQDIAKAVIDRPVQASWKGEITVLENSSDEKSPFEQAWEDLAYKHKLKSLFIRADKLTGIGRYSVVLFGLDDVKKIEDYAKPVSKRGKRKLLYLKPLSEASAKIAEFEKDNTNERYGLPLLYEIVVNNSNTNDGNSQQASFKVHYTRILHIVEGIIESEVYGTPRLKAIYNRLIDLDKIIGGDGEMFWRGARPGYTGNVDSEYQMSPETLADLRKQIEEFEHNLKRVLINEGVEYKALAQQIADPSPHADVQIQMISAETGIPKRILVGSERGELSSAQDKQEWISYVSSRREEQNEPMILRPFLEMCMDLGILPTVAYFEIVWDKLFSLSDKEKVQMGKDRSMAVRDYVASPVAVELLPIASFLEYVLAFDDKQIENIMGKIDIKRLQEVIDKTLEAGNKKDPNLSDTKETKPEGEIA